MTTDADGWIEHDGKGMPVDGLVNVDVKLRYGGRRHDARAVELDWYGCGPTTVTHYRIVDEAKPAAMATKVSDDAMTVWDHYAAAALTGLLAANATYGGSTSNHVALAADAGRIADAMMTEGAKK